VVGLDVTLRMIQLARAKISDARLGGFHRRRHAGVAVSRRLVRRGDDRIRFAQRVRSGHGVAELFRVVRPAAGVLSLDFNRPTNRGVRLLYLAYLTVVGSALGWLLHRDPDTYRYIPASLRTYPAAPVSPPC